MDEPTNGLDIVVKRQVLQLILDIAAAEGVTVVIASHFIEDVERLADTLGVLRGGRFTFVGAVDALKARFHRIQVVLPTSFTLRTPPAVIHSERRGQVLTLTVEGDVDPIAQELHALGAKHIQPLEMDLSESFRYLMEKEGYTRETIRLESL